MKELSRVEQITFQLLDGHITESEMQELDRLVAEEQQAAKLHLSLMQLEAVLRGSRRDFDLSSATMQRLGELQGRQVAQQVMDRIRKQEIHPSKKDTQATKRLVQTRWSCWSLAVGKIAAVASMAAGVTFGLFFTMHSLVLMKDAKLSRDTGRRKVEYIRTRRDSDVKMKNRELPEKKALDKQPEPPSLRMSTSPSLDQQGGFQIAAPDVPQVQSSVRLAGGPHLGAPSDAEIIPLVRIQPIYPRSAAERRIEGWVRIEFTIGVTGRVKDARVIAAKPPNVFDQAALRAVRKWKYKPKIQDGKPVERRGVQVKMIFELDPS